MAKKPAKPADAAPPADPLPPPAEGLIRVRFIRAVNVRGASGDAAIPEGTIDDLPLASVERWERRNAVERVTIDEPAEEKGE